MPDEKKTLEVAFTELDTVIARLEDREISLDDSFKVYEEGMKLLKFCNEAIDTVEKKMLIINDDGGLDEF